MEESLTNEANLIYDREALFENTVCDLLLSRAAVKDLVVCKTAENTFGHSSVRPCFVGKIWPCWCYY